MNLDHDFFQVSKSSEDQKKVFTKNGTLFSPNSSGDLRSDAHRSQIFGGDADEDHTQIIGGIKSNYWGGYIPPSPRVSAPLLRTVATLLVTVKKSLKFCRFKSVQNLVSFLT